MVESIYAQCDVDSNEYLLLGAFTNHRKNSSAVSVENKKVVVKGQYTPRKLTLVGTFVASGRTAPHHGQSYPILIS